MTPPTHPPTPLRTFSVSNTHSWTKASKNVEMEDLDFIIDKIGREKQYEHQVRLIYNELVSGISETFGQSWIEPYPYTENFKMEKEEENQGSEEGQEKIQQDTDEYQVNSNQEVDTGASFEKVIWKQRGKEEEKKNGKSTKGTKKKKEDVSAAILKNQEEIMRRLNKIEDEKRQGEKRKVETDEKKEKTEEEPTQDTSPMEPVKAIIGATRKFLRQNTDTRVVNEMSSVKMKAKEKTSESEAGCDIEMEVDEGLRKEYEEIDEFEEMSNDNHNTKDYKQDLREKLELNKNKRQRVEMTAIEATQDLRSLLGVKERICTGNCEDLRPHEWCKACSAANQVILEETYSQTWDFARKIPKEAQNEALEWAVKRGNKPKAVKRLQQESKKENYKRKMARLLTPNHPTFKISEGQEIDNIFKKFQDKRDHVGRSFMQEHYSTCNPIFTKMKDNNYRCCSEEEPVGTIRQYSNHAIEDHSHTSRSQVQCLACLAIGREATFCSPGRLARHISNVHEKLLMCGHQRVHMSSRSDTWLQAFSQMISSFTIEKLHMQGYLADTFYINKPQKPRH